MKIAIVHDWLNHKAGGGEAVLFRIAQLYPQADIFTLAYDKSLFAEKLRGRVIKTSYLQRLPKFIKRRPQYLLPLVRRATRSLNFNDYDLIISSSSAWVKNIRKPASAKHVCYCHSPARMLWDSWPQYLDKKNLPAVVKFIVIRWCSKLRLWDFYATRDVDMLIANSAYVAGRIKKFYGREVDYIYPPVEVSSALKDQPKKDYYLVLSVLADYKNIELVVSSFIENKKRLVIAGDGPARTNLEKMARGNDNISFSGRVSDSEKWRLLAGAKALIFPSVEDFGITPVEAMASATPVVARVGGGLSETIIASKTGVFFTENNVASLNNALKRIDKVKFKSTDLTEQAVKYDSHHFDSNFKSAVVKL